jgi:polysaccharide export outer membrane protein
VITVISQPLTFTALGATGKNDEIPFEAQGISLAQALARAGGLLDTRADAQGVFIFRFRAGGCPRVASARLCPQLPDGRVPVVYRLQISRIRCRSS